MNSQDINLLSLQNYAISKCRDFLLDNNFNYFETEEMLKEMGKSEYSPFGYIGSIYELKSMDAVVAWYKSFTEACSKAQIEALKRKNEEEKSKLIKDKTEQDKKKYGSSMENFFEQTKNNTSFSQDELNQLNQEKNQYKKDEVRDKTDSKPKKGNLDEESKKKYIGDIEMDLAEKNVPGDKLSQRLGVSDWKEKINNCVDWSDALQKRTHLWNIIRKLKDEYTCAECGKKGEDYTAYYAGDQKCCSWECEKALRGKDKKKNPTSTKAKIKNNNFGFSSIDEFFAWWSKMGITKIEWDFKNKKLVIECGNNRKLDINQSGLNSKQKEELSNTAKANSKPITLQEIRETTNNNEKNSPNNNSGNGATIAGAIVVVGIIFAAIISIVIYTSRSKD